VQHPPGRLILSQSPEGFWDASSTTAFALEARCAAETDALPPQSLYQRVTTAASIFATEDTAEALAYMGGAAMDDARLLADRKHGAAPADGAEISDCPLTCPPSAILESVPAALAAVRDAAPEVDPGRVWTTILCICVLERMKYSFIWGDGCVRVRMRASLAGCAARAHSHSRASRSIMPAHISLPACAATCTRRRSALSWTVRRMTGGTRGCQLPAVDGAFIHARHPIDCSALDPTAAAREWVEAQEAAHPPLAAVLEDGALRKSAASLTRLWARTFEQRVLDLRSSKGIRAQMNRSHVRRPAH
jgi:hypothetical protein